MARIKGSDVWTWLLVTVVALLIWFWAYGETRETLRASFRIRIVPPEENEWVVSPRDFTADVELSGSRLAIQKARELPMPLELHLGDDNELPASPGLLSASVAAVLGRHPPLRRTGASVVSADPSSVEIRVDRLVEVTAAVRAVLPRLQTAGEVEVDPAQVTVRLPARLRDVAGDDLVVEAVVDQSRLDQLEPGRFYSLSAKLHLPARLADKRSIAIDPPNATVDFTVRSRIEQVTLPSVNVQIAGPWQDHEEYVIEIDDQDKTLQNVTIKADGDLIRRIQADEVQVVALVHLSTNEKDNRIESKPLTCFMAIPPDGPAVLVDAEVPDTTGPPVIGLTITPRTKE